MKKLLVIVKMTLISIFTFACSQSNPDNLDPIRYFEYNGIVFECNGDQIYIFKTTSDFNETNLVLPGYFNDLPVTKIRANTFVDLNIDSVDFSKMVHLHTIGYNAFSFNNIEILDFSGLTSLVNLRGFHHNGITSINLSGLINLEEINGFSFNEISKINFTGLTNLKYLNGFNNNNNSLTNIDLRDLLNLRYLRAFSHNDLKTIDIRGLDMYYMAHTIHSGNPDLIILQEI